MSLPDWSINLNILIGLVMRVCQNSAQKVFYSEMFKL